MTKEQIKKKKISKNLLGETDLMEVRSMQSGGEYPPKYEENKN